MVAKTEAHHGLRCPDCMGELERLSTGGAICQRCGRAWLEPAQGAPLERVGEKSKPGEASRG